MLEACVRVYAYTIGRTLEQLASGVQAAYFLPSSAWMGVEKTQTSKLQTSDLRSQTSKLRPRNFGPLEK